MTRPSLCSNNKFENFADRAPIARMSVEIEHHDCVIVRNVETATFRVRCQVVPPAVIRNGNSFDEMVVGGRNRGRNPEASCARSHN
jgi:hypothetical protein